MNKKVRNDIILVAAIVVIVAATLLILNIFKTKGSYAVVKIDGVETARYALSEDTEVLITAGSHNEFTNLLVIENGKAYIKDANCADKICVNTGAAQYSGETIVCLPHKVVIEIISSKADSGIDMTT